MARSSPQSFEKRQRERRKQQKRAEKLERKLVRNEEKRFAKHEEAAKPQPFEWKYSWGPDDDWDESEE